MLPYAKDLAILDPNNFKYCLVSIRSYIGIHFTKYFGLLGLDSGGAYKINSGKIVPAIF